MAHLAQLNFFQSADGAEVVRVLQQFNIRHVEQLKGLLQNRASRSALVSLNLPVSLSDIEGALIAPGVAVGNNLSQTGEALRFRDGSLPLSAAGAGLGYRQGASARLPTFSQPLPAFDRPEAREAATRGELNRVLSQYKPAADPLPASHFLYADNQFPEPKNQGTRGTCVAFAVASALLAYVDCHVPRFSRSTLFSEQHLYYEAKLIDPDRNQDGTRLEFALSALVDRGICAEQFLPYKNYVDWSHALLFEKAAHARQTVRERAEGNRIAGFAHLPEGNIVDTIKSCIVRNLAVAIGVLTFREAWGNDYARQKGEIELPIVVQEQVNGTLDEVVFDTSDGGHAVCIVGFEDDRDPLTARPGGGSFLFKNSWGTDWAQGNEHQRGYGHLPYAYVERYWLEAAVISAMRVAPKKAKSE